MATTKPITFDNVALSGGLVDKLRLSAMISQEINLLLKDSTNLRNTGLISYQGSINGLGSDTVRVRLAGLDGYDSMSAAVSEISDESANTTALTIDSADIAAARQFIIYEMDDLAGMTGLSGSPDINPFRIAQSIAGSYETRFAELTCAAASGFTATAGANTTTLSVDDFFNAIFKIEQSSNLGGLAVGAPGAYAMVLSPLALTQLQDSLRNETGNAVSRMESSASMLEAKSENFAGTLFGVDVYRSAHVTENGSAGYDNYLLSPMALGYVDGIPQNIPGSADLMQIGKCVVEFDRRPMSAKTFIVGHGYMGVAKIQDAKGVKVLSKR
tara:strand:- start:603 stop:1586 length:984 start_codon:yes stop_codon:yes gene_type:complete